MFRSRSFLLLLPAILLMLSCQSSPPTAQEIVARCADAMSGDSRITDVRSISCDISFPDHDYPVTIEVVRPNRIRTQGGDTYALVFDGTSAAFLYGGSSGEGPELVPEEQLKDFEVDIAFLYPAFFEYEATFRGLIDTTGFTAYKLEVLLPKEGRMTYYIDPESYLLMEAVTNVVVDGEEYSWGRKYSAYQEISGVRYFKTFDYKGRDGEMVTATFDRVGLNGDIDMERFAIPMTLR